MTKPSLKKRFDTLCQALHQHECHPHFHSYHVRVGKRKERFSLEGNRILHLAEGQEAVRVGAWYLKHFGTRKDIFAYRMRRDINYVFAADPDQALYDELLRHAHQRRIAPGFQYGALTIELDGQKFTTPNTKPDLHQASWQIWSYLITSHSLQVMLYRQTPPGCEDGSVKEMVHEMRGTPSRRASASLAPVTLKLNAQARNGTLHGSYLVGTPGTHLNEPTSWVITLDSLMINLRLPRRVIE